MREQWLFALVSSHIVESTKQKTYKDMGMCFLCRMHKCKETLVAFVFAVQKSVQIYVCVYIYNFTNIRLCIGRSR